MNINEITIGEAKELVRLFSGMSGEKECVFEAGRKYFIRTVTYHYLGECVDIKGGFVKLRKASWVADSGRFHVAMNSGVLSEVECYPADLIVNVNINTIVDFCEWKHPFPTESK